MLRGDLVLGIDLGTQRLKVMLVDLENTRIVGETSTSIPTLSKQPGAMEQDPEGWWESCCLLLQRLLDKNDVSPQQVKAIGLAGEMHSLVLLDKGSKPIYPAILWADSRAATYREELEGAGIDLWNPPGAAYTALKLLWLRGEKPDVLAQAKTLLFPKDYLRYRLTGTIGTDWTDASGSLLWNFSLKSWDEVLKDRLKLDAINFPTPADPLSIVGSITKQAAGETGLKEGTPVITGLGDVAAAVVGAGAVEPDTVLINAGTAAQIISVTDLPRSAMRPGGKRSAYLFELGFDDLTFTMGSVPSAGFSLNWWRRILDEELTFAELDNLASRAECGCGGAFYLPYLSGTGTPYLVDKALGGFVGLSGFTNQAHLSRAVMEGVAFGIRQCLEVVNGSHKKILVTGGITRSSLWTKILADVLGQPLQLRQVKDASGIGAVILAAKAIGAIDDVVSLAQLLGGTTLTKEPCPENVEIYEDNFKKFVRWAEVFVQSEL